MYMNTDTPYVDARNIRVRILPFCTLEERCRVFLEGRFGLLGSGSRLCATANESITQASCHANRYVTYSSCASLLSVYQPRFTGQFSPVSEHRGQCLQSASRAGEARHSQPACTVESEDRRKSNCPGMSECARPLGRSDFWLERDPDEYNSDHLCQCARLLWSPACEPLEREIDLRNCRWPGLVLRFCGQVTVPGESLAGWGKRRSLWRNLPRRYTDASPSPCEILSHDCTLLGCVDQKTIHCSTVPSAFWS